MSGVAIRPDVAGNALDPFFSRFVLPETLEATEPPEARGLARDGVRMMISSTADNSIVHARARDLPDYLNAGDLLVINTSGTLAASVPAMRADGTRLMLHLSTQRSDGRWLVELRLPVAGAAPIQFGGGVPGERLALPDGGTVRLYRPHGRRAPLTIAGEGQRLETLPHTEPLPLHDAGGGEAAPKGTDARLWVADLALPVPLAEYLAAHGQPIRYHYVRDRWPIEYYQTVYAREPGSAEMPSAGRPISERTITQLTANGVMVAPIVLHTGVASLEADEAPYEEYYRVPETTARLLNMARESGGRVVAVGTTVVRALESCIDFAGNVHAREGWTDLVITPEQPVRSVNGLLTGLHEPRASHLAMLAALCGESHLHATYSEALRERYLWHEFGDVHLILTETGSPQRLDRR
ncbi:MAG TPA: S-adenosylmethionine:tRNA ribosyltransferase-isomerase [Candidatus Kapabacteria bacterium]|nr:S-adenosylmethionine:tRNA ribosyltransferase-isomerase [Candidatus Kapabacteria bacterium]